MTKTAVVILNYNGEKFLKDFLQLVVDYSPNADIYVVDNASTDNSVEFIKLTFPSVKLIEFTENYGFTKGYNEALKQIEATYYVLLNSDVEVTENWLTPITDFMDKNEAVAACQPKILSYHHKTHFEYAGASGGYLDSLAFPYCRGRIFDVLEEDLGQYDDTCQVFWATGACLFIKSEVYHNLGGLDEDFFAHMEEIDLCWRINLLGKKVFVIPESEVYHVGGGTLSKSNPQKTYLNFRNNLAMLYKNTPSQSLLYKLPLKMILDWAAGLKFWKDNSFSHFWAVIRAHAYFISHFKRNFNKRIANKKMLDINSSVSLFPNLLPSNYFIKGEKFFSDLNK
jgi:GT2 family glycosyltransferase